MKGHLKYEVDTEVIDFVRHWHVIERDLEADKTIKIADFVDANDALMFAELKQSDYDKFVESANIISARQANALKRLADM